jgi:hypothetical protein
LYNRGSTWITGKLIESNVDHGFNYFRVPREKEVTGYCLAGGIYAAATGRKAFAEAEAENFYQFPEEGQEALYRLAKLINPDAMIKVYRYGIDSPSGYDYYDYVCIFDKTLGEWRNSEQYEEVGILVYEIVTGFNDEQDSYTPISKLLKRAIR